MKTNSTRKNKNKELGLLITTCKHYFTNIPNLIKNIEECNFPKENVLIVSGQENENSKCYESSRLLLLRKWI